MNTYEDLTVAQCTTPEFCGIINITTTQATKTLSVGSLGIGLFNIDLRCKNNFFFTAKIKVGTYPLFIITPPKFYACSYRFAVLLNGSCCNNVTTNGNKSACCASNRTFFNDTTNTTDCSSYLCNLSILLLLLTAFF